jgi:hypothetical protein
VCFPSEQRGSLGDVDHPKDVGDRSTLAVMIALRELGYTISVPFGENARYDLVIDDGNDLLRVQCKTGRLRNGAVRFSTCSTYVHHKTPRAPQRSYLGEIDYFAVYCRETAGVYLIPIRAVPTSREGALRIDPARNGQRRHVRPAPNYQIGEVALELKPRPRASSGARGSCA